MERASTLLSTPTMGSPADFDQLSQQATLPSGNLASFVSSKQLFQHLPGFSYIGLACSLWTLDSVHSGQFPVSTVSSVSTVQCGHWTVSSVDVHCKFITTQQSMASSAFSPCVCASFCLCIHIPYAYRHRCVQPVLIKTWQIMTSVYLYLSQYEYTPLPFRLPLPPTSCQSLHLQCAAVN